MKSKLNLTLIAILFQANALFAQGQGVFLSHYVFPEFREGVVVKKSGSVDKATMNYNSLTQEVIFMQDTTKLALAETNTIDAVYIGKAKFIPVESVFYEEVETDNTVKLYVQHECKVTSVDAGKDIGFGMTSQTTAIVNLSSLNSPSGLKLVYDLKLPSGYKVTPFSEFWLKTGSKFIKITNTKQLQKALPGKEALINEYIKTNKPDFKNREDMINLIKTLGK